MRERLPGDGLEDRVLRGGAVPAQRGDRSRRPCPGLRRGHSPGVADGPPDAFAVAPDMGESNPAARRPHPDAEALQVAVADIVGYPARPERVGAALVEMHCGHGFPSRIRLRAGTENAPETPAAALARGKRRIRINELALKVRSYVLIEEAFAFHVERL